MTYRILFNEEDRVKTHEIDVLKKYGTLYDLLENLVTNKININKANADQLHLIINLMQGYSFGKEIIDKKKSDSWDNKALDKAKRILYSSK